MNALAKARAADQELPAGLQQNTQRFPLADVILGEKVAFEIRELLDEIADAGYLQSKGLRTRHKVMFMGPPGNGKTTIAKGIATELNLPLYFIRAEDLITDELGGTSKRIKAIFDFASTHQCILFFDEFDAVGLERDKNKNEDMKRLVSTLLVQLDSVPENIIVLAATNHPGSLDKAIWRRFQVRIELDRPGTPEFLRYLKEFCARKGIPTETMDFSKIELMMNFENLSECEQFCEDSLRRFYRQREAIPFVEVIKETKQRWHTLKKSIVH